jgi:predicted negative regulator of RcsB-dependent stress response
MMAYDLEEQEQLAGIKAFWERRGNLILIVATAALVAVAGWRGWGWYQMQQAMKASAVWADLQKAAEAKDVAKVKAAGDVLLQQYSRSAYAQMAAMLAASTYVQAGDPKSAQAALQWAGEHAVDDEFRHIAKIRLAGLLLDQNALEEALKVVSAADTGAFKGLYADRRADVLVAQGKTEAARAAYREAMDALQPSDPLRRIVQTKLDALGGAGS